MSSRRVASLLLVVVVACNNVKATHPKKEGNTIRYRLLLRGNPVSSSDAAHCFAQCQAATTPNAYVDCLAECPGFEKTPGEYCSNTDVPPEAACLTVRVVPVKKELPPGLVVLAIVGEVALVVGAASLCSISSTQCGMQMPAPK